MLPLTIKTLKESLSPEFFNEKVITREKKKWHVFDYIGTEKNIRTERNIIILYNNC